MKNLGHALLIAGTVAATLGCENSASGPAWSGGSASVSLQWTINGLPATPGLCTAVSGDFVALWADIADPGCTPGEEGCGDALDTWLWNCTAGSAQTGLDFRSGTVWLTWALVRDDGSVRQRTSWQSVDLTSGNRGFTFDFTPGFLGPLDAAVVSTWTIDGAPADAATCSSAGAETVRLFTRITGAAAETPADFPCADGSATTGIGYRAYQSYDLRWELLDAAGDTLAPYPATGWQTLRFVEGDNPFSIDFPGPAGPDASLAATWTVRGAAADATSCADAHASTVRLTWRPAGTATETTADFPCADGTAATTDVLHSGTDYDLAWDLLDDADASLVRVDWITFTAAAGPNTHDADFLVGGDLEVTLEWADAVAAAAWGACDLPASPVETIGYRLEDSTTHDIFDEVDLATAGIACTTTLPWTNVPFGTYDLTVDGAAASPATAAWHVVCAGITVDAVAGGTATCRVEAISD